MDGNVLMTRWMTFSETNGATTKQKLHITISVHVTSANRRERESDRESEREITVLGFSLYLRERTFPDLRSTVTFPHWARFK